MKAVAINPSALSRSSGRRIYSAKKMQSTAHNHEKGWGRLFKEMTSPRRIAIGLTVAFAPTFIASLFRGGKPDVHQHSFVGKVDWQELFKDLSVYFLRLVSVMMAAIFLDNIVPKFKLHKPNELHVHEIHADHEHGGIEHDHHHHEEADPAKSRWIEVKATEPMQKGGFGEALKDTFGKTNLTLALSIASVNTLIEGIQNWVSYQVDAAGQAWVSLIGALTKVISTFMAARFIIGREEFKTAGDMLKNWDKLITGFVCPCHGTMICITEIEAIIQSLMQLSRKPGDKQ